MVTELYLIVLGAVILQTALINPLLKKLFKIDE